MQDLPVKYYLFICTGSQLKRATPGRSPPLPLLLFTSESLFVLLKTQQFGALQITVFLKCNSLFNLQQCPQSNVLLLMLQNRETDI